MDIFINLIIGILNELKISEFRYIMEYPIISQTSPKCIRVTTRNGIEFYVELIDHTISIYLNHGHYLGKRQFFNLANPNSINLLGNVILEFFEIQSLSEYNNYYIKNIE